MEERILRLIRPPPSFVDGVAGHAISEGTYTSVGGGCVYSSLVQLRPKAFNPHSTRGSAAGRRTGGSAVDTSAESGSLHIVGNTSLQVSM